MRLGSRTRRVGMYAGGFLGPFGGSMVVVLVPEFRDVFDVSTATAAWSYTAYLIPFAILQLVSGTIGGRLGRDRVLRIAFLVYALASIATVFMNTITPFLIARGVQGAANAFTSPLVLAKLASSTPQKSLGKAMGTYASVQTSGQALAPLIGGLAGAIDYRLAFVVAGVASLVLMVIVPEGNAKPDKADAPKLRSALTPRTGWLAVTSAAFFLCLLGIGIVVSLKAADDFGVGVDARGLLLAAFGIAGIIAGRPAGVLLDSIGQRKVLLGGVAGCAASLALIAFAPNEWVLGVLWFSAGFFASVVQTSLNTLIVTAAVENRGGAISLIASFRFTGAAFAPIIWIPLYNVSSELAFLVAAGGVGIVALAALQAIKARNTVLRPT